MFKGLFEKEKTATEIEIDKIYQLRTLYAPTSNEYQILNMRLKELLELKEAEKKKPRFQVSGDTIVKVGIGAAVCALIVFKEDLVGPITSKALGIATKFIG